MLHGGRDRILSQQGALTMARELRADFFLNFLDAGHMVSDEAPNLVSSLMEAAMERGAESDLSENYRTVESVLGLEELSRGAAAHRHQQGSRGESLVDVGAREVFHRFAPDSSGATWRVDVKTREFWRGGGVSKSKL